MEAFMAVQIDANRQLIERYRKALESEDIQTLAALQMETLADDYVQEWPQSGERIRRDSAIEINKKYNEATGTAPKMKLRRLTTKDDLAIVEGTIDYGDGTPVSYVGIVELRDGKIARNTEYFANPFEAPDWRKPYVERM
jgi:ketosteroid isomerase-like protein